MMKSYLLPKASFLFFFFFLNEQKTKQQKRHNGHLFLLHVFTNAKSHIALHLGRVVADVHYEKKALNPCDH